MKCINCTYYDPEKFDQCTLGIISNTPNLEIDYKIFGCELGKPSEEYSKIQLERKTKIEKAAADGKDPRDAIKEIYGTFEAFYGSGDFNVERIFNKD